MAADGIGRAEHQLRDPRGQAGVDQTGEQRLATCRRFLRWLGDDAASRRQRGRELLGHQIDREVPWAERRDDADRLLDHHRALPGRTNEHTTIGALGFLGVPLEQSGRAGDLAARLDQRFALFGRQQHGDRIGTLAHQRGSATQDHATRLDVGRSPRREAAFGGGKRFVEVGGGRHRHCADRRTGRRVHDLVRVASLTDTPAVAYEKGQGLVVISVTHFRSS